MGTGVAHAVAQAGMRVVLVDISDEILARALSEIRRDVRMAALYRKGPPSASADEILGRIECSTELAPMEQADLVVDNVSEKKAVREKAMRALDAVARPECIFAANTSAMPIGWIAGLTNRPDRVLGMHFMNPVPLKPVVEVIRGPHTSDQTLAVAEAFLKKMGKTSVVVGDGPGFVSNRVLMLTINEAIWLVHDGVASARDVDRIFTGCLEHKLGPLHTADLIGLDTILDSLLVLNDWTRDSKFRPCPLLLSKVHAGELGRKSGRGFFAH